MANLNQNSTFAGLGTAASFIAPDTDVYEVAGTLTLPTVITAGFPSTVVVTINKNGSPAYTGTAGSRGFKAVIQCTAADLVTVVLSSSTATDQALNAIKTTTSITQGV